MIIAETIRLTTSEAIVRYLIAQRIVVDGIEVPLFPGVLAIFGHGNVTSLGHALEMHRDELPVWRGQSEEGMGLAAAAFAKARRRQQVMVCTSSIGPGATNFITAAGVGMANRLPILFISGDTFQSRIPDPVLQQVEHFGTPSTTVNDAFRSVVRYWDRLTRPSQVVTSLPQVVSMFLDPGDCGPAFLGLPQDIAAESYDYPVAFFEKRVRSIPRPRPDVDQLSAAIKMLATASRPVIIAGGGVHYSLAEQHLSDFALKHGIPVVETMAGKSCLLADHPCYIGPIGVTGADAANTLCREADVIVAIGTRLQDFTTGSWTVFDPETSIIGINAARYDTVKNVSIAVVGDARATLIEMSKALGDWKSATAWSVWGRKMRTEVQTLVNSRIADDGVFPMSYAQIIGVVHQAATEEDYVLAAAGGLPGELNVNWLSKGVMSFDCEYGFSCMGYEISGAWGAAFARTSGQVFALVGDGSYLMLNSDIYASVLSGKKFILVVLDNAGYAVIERLQIGKGGRSYNNMLRDSRGPGSEVRVDFRAHAQALGAHAVQVSSRAELVDALARARNHERTSVIVVRARESDWTPGGAFWQVGVPETSELARVQVARAEMDAGLRVQRQVRA